MATEYATLAQVKARIDGLTGTDRDDLIGDLIVAASRAIDEHCARRFYLDDTATARVYNPRRRVVGDRLMVDDIGSETGLLVKIGYAGGTYSTVGGTVEFEPENAIVLGEAITDIVIAGYRWPSDGATRVQVTARWGWPAVPAVVQEATIIQTLRLYKRKDAPEGVLGNSEWGTIRLSRIDPDVAAMLAHLVVPGIG